MPVSRKIYRVIGGVIGFVLGLWLFTYSPVIWTELGKLEVFGFMAIFVMFLLIIIPLALIAAPFIGVWLGARLGGKIYDIMHNI